MSDARTAPGGDSRPLVVDARGLRCPLPVIRLGAALRDLPGGARVVLLATDPAARTDVAAMCRMRGHVLVAVDDHHERAEGAEGADHTSYTVEVRRTPPEGAPATPRPA